MVPQVWFVTLVTRPQNLPRIGESIVRASRRAGDAVPWRWLQVWDGRRLDDCTPPAPPDDFPRDREWIARVTPPDGWAGEPFLRNFVLDECQLAPADLIAWVDDDNLAERDFLAALAAALEAQPGAAVVFDQVDRHGHQRLSAAPENMRYTGVDTAQVIAPREVYGDLRFENRAEGCDGFLYAALYAHAPARFVFVNEPRVIYNALEG